ncbi:MAG: hypothetical protein V3U06_01820 [Candidatus Binatia bacterium]
MVRPIRHAQSSTEAHGPEALEGQAHHPEQSRRTDGVSKGEKRQLSPHKIISWAEHGDSNPVFDQILFVRHKLPVFSCSGIYFI